MASRIVEYTKTDLANLVAAGLDTRVGMFNDDGKTLGKLSISLTLIGDWFLGGVAHFGEVWLVGSPPT